MVREMSRAEETHRIFLLMLRRLLEGFVFLYDNLDCVIEIIRMAERILKGIMF